MRGETSLTSTNSPPLQDNLRIRIKVPKNVHKASESDSLYTKNRKKRKKEKEDAQKYLLIADDQDGKSNLKTTPSAITAEDMAKSIFEECAKAPEKISSPLSTPSESIKETGEQQELAPKTDKGVLSVVDKT